MVTYSPDRERLEKEVRLETYRAGGPEDSIETRPMQQSACHEPIDSP